jgi:hypothetical protein
MVNGRYAFDVFIDTGMTVKLMYLYSGSVLYYINSEFDQIFFM